MRGDAGCEPDRSLPMLRRVYRRVVIRHFGSTKNFIIWISAVVATIYVIDTYILTKDRVQSIVTGKNEVQSKEQSSQGNGIDSAAGKQDSVKQEVKEAEVEKPKAGPPPAPPGPPAQDAKPPSNDVQPAGDVRCGMEDECPKGKYAYHVKSGEGRDGSPTICFNGNYAVTAEKGNAKRGLNMVVINEKTLAIEDVRNFDLYQEDAILLRYLKLGIQDDHLILAASQDEASYNLKAEAKKWMNKYGSSAIDKMKFRDSLVVIGQRGLTHGSAIEKHQARGNEEFASPAEIKGCLALPLGRIEKIKVEKEEAEGAGPPANVQLGEELPNCGVTKDCGPNGFAVHLYTGKENKEGPKICVGGKYVLAKGLNDGGRGVNIVIVDPKTKDVIRVGHFDTYSEDSSNLEIFIEMMNDKEIILAVTHDDASKNLNTHAVKILETLGSSMIAKMSFRDVWGFVGQKGMEGHSTIEEIEFAGAGSAWPRPIDMKLCVPTELKGSQIKPDPMANKNEKRRKFCSKYDGYGDFCETDHVDETLTPAPLTDKTLENHSIFQVPIVVVPGLNHNAVRMQLETLIMNPGVRPEMVIVMFDEKFDEPAALAELFNFKTDKLSSSTKYVFQVQKALERVWEDYPEAKHVILLEEEVILAPDFLYFMAQCMTAVESDDSLLGISAFNENGYQGLSNTPNVAYRGDTFPGLGFLLKRSVYDEQMKNNMQDCCLKRSWEGWFGGKLAGKEMIIPDVSRVYRRPYEGLSEMANFLTELFNRDRVTNLDSKPKITNAGSLTKYKYEESIHELLKASNPLDTANVGDCLEGKGLGFYIPETADKALAIYFEQDNTEDFRILSSLCKCFKLFYLKGYKPRGLHNGMLRFTYKGNTILLVGSSTPYYKHMPKDYKPVKPSQLSSGS